MLSGRESEIRRIDRMLDDAKHGRSGVLLISGEAGVGKTAILDYARSVATHMNVMTVRGFEPEQKIGFAGLSQIFSSMVEDISLLPDAQARALRSALALGAADTADRFSVYAATLGMLAQVAERRPLLLVVDDLPWLDAPSAEALTFAARRLVAENICALFTARSAHSASDQDWHLPVCVLEGLDDDAVTHLVTSRTAISGLGVPVMIDVGTTGMGAGMPGGLGSRIEHAHPLAVDNLAATFPDMTIIAAHPGWPWVDEMTAVALHKGNVYWELSGWAPKYFPEQLRKDIRGRLRDKIMFGSDHPSLPYERIFAEWEQLGFTDEVLADVFHRNAERVLEL